MKELIDKLVDAIEKAQMACATQQLPDGKEAGFHFGRLQGTHAGLVRATKIVENFLNEIDQQEQDDADDQSSQRG